MPNRPILALKLLLYTVQKKLYGMSPLQYRKKYGK